MSEEKIEALRRIYSERARGNFAADRALLAEDAAITWEVPEGRTVSHGLEEAVRNFRSFLSQWDSFRTEAEEFIELGEQNILVVGRIRGIGKHSGAATEANTFEVWVFDGNQVVGQHQSFSRAGALEAAGLTE
jgi:ketosteroid isomerase-like protein